MSSPQVLLHVVSLRFQSVSFFGSATSKHSLGKAVRSIALAFGFFLLAALGATPLPGSAKGAKPAEETEKQYIQARGSRDFCKTDGINELYRIMDYHKAMVAYFAGQCIGSDGTVQQPVDIPVPTLQ